jgi:hypothetical protein
MDRGSTSSFLSRRDFVGLALAAISAPLLARAAHAERTSLVCYLDESGRPQDQGFAVGLLAVADPSKHAGKINELRREVGYFRTLRYKSTDRQKIAFVKRLTDYFLAEEDLAFFGMVGGRQNRWPDSTDDRATLYATHYSHVIRMARCELTCLDQFVRERHATTDRDAALDRFLGQLTDPGSRAQIPAPKDDLSQLCGFLTGLMHSRNAAIASSVKRELIDHCLPRLAVDPRKYQVRELSI